MIGPTPLDGPPPARLLGRPAHPLDSCVLPKTRFPSRDLWDFSYLPPTHLRPFPKDDSADPVEGLDFPPDVFVNPAMRFYSDELSVRKSAIFKAIESTSDVDPRDNAAINELATSEVWTTLRKVEDLAKRMGDGSVLRDLLDGIEKKNYLMRCLMETDEEFRNRLLHGSPTPKGQTESPRREKAEGLGQ